MANFCGYCGRPSNGNFTNCGNCGAPFNVVPGEYLAKEKRKNHLLFWGIVLSVLLVIVIVTNVVAGFVGSKGITRKVMNAYINSDVDTLLYVASDYYYLRSDQNGTSLTPYYENQVKGIHSRYANYVGEKYKVTYKIKDSYELDDNRAVAVFDKMNAMDGYEIDNVTKVVMLELEVKIQGKDRSFTEPWKLVVVREARHWRVFSVTINNTEY